MTAIHTTGQWDALVNREWQNNTVRANGRVICELPGSGNPWVLEGNARLIAGRTGSAGGARSDRRIACRARRRRDD